MNTFQAPYGLRLLACPVSVLSLVLGLWGVSVCRNTGMRSALVEISTEWYWLAIIPPLAVISLALNLPARIISSRRGILPVLLILVRLAAASTAPLLYVVYDLEQRLREQPPTRQRTAAPLGGRVVPDNLLATLAADRALPAAVAELGR